MSSLLKCDEIGRYITFGEPLMAGTRSDVKFFKALCEQVIDYIPKSMRRAELCKSGEGGVDIYEATAGLASTDAYSESDFALGKFSFSISQEVAERCLPKHIRKYDVSA